MAATANEAFRGVIGALAMSGMRTFAADLGLIEKTPPEAIAEEPARGLMSRVPPDRRQIAVRVIHLAVGASGGAMFGLMPEGVRRRAWAGPAWGMSLWLSYEGAVAPALGLWHAGPTPPGEQAVFMADHLVYGYILSQAHRE